MSEELKTMLDKGAIIERSQLNELENKLSVPKV